MKRIGLYLDSAPGGGTFQYNLSILDALVALPADRYRLFVVYSQSAWREYLEAYDVHSNYVDKGFWARGVGRVMRCHRLSAAVWRRISRFVHPVGRALWRFNCDLWIFPTQDGLSYQFPVHSLEVVHDLMHRYESRFPEVSEHGEFERREKHYAAMCRYASGILVDSEIGREQLIESYGIDGYRVHDLPFIAPHYISGSDGANDIGQRYSIPEKFLFYPAQFWEHKNHRALIQAMARLADMPDIHLVLVGSKMNGYDALVDEISRCGLAERVHFLGYVADADMAGLYKRARALVMPTFFGPTNIPPLEAFVCGCPVAVSDIYAMPQQMGGAALLFDPTSTDQIADVIRRLWTDDELCAELVKSGHGRIEKWNQQHFNKRLREIIDKVIESIDVSGVREQCDR